MLKFHVAQGASGASFDDRKPKLRRIDFGKEIDIECVLIPSIVANTLGGCVIVPAGYGDNRGGCYRDGGYYRGDGSCRARDHNYGDANYRDYSYRYRGEQGSQGRLFREMAPDAPPRLLKRS